MAPPALLHPFPGVPSPMVPSRHLSLATKAACNQPSTRPPTCPPRFFAQCPPGGCACHSFQTPLVTGDLSPPRLSSVPAAHLAHSPPWRCSWAWPQDPEDPQQAEEQGQGPAEAQAPGGRTPGRRPGQRCGLHGDKPRGSRGLCVCRFSSPVCVADTASSPSPGPRVTSPLLVWTVLRPPTRGQVLTQPPGNVTWLRSQPPAGVTKGTRGWTLGP